MNSAYRIAIVLLPGLFQFGLADAPDVYYIDYEQGSDLRDGRSPQSAFQHCPGDPAATGVAKGTALASGSRVIFKGGIVYRGSVTVGQSGAAGNAITYDGNTRGEFGTGPAVLDGSEIVTGWKRCASPDECGENPNWSKIWRAEVTFRTDPFVANLYDGDRPLAIAQEPNLKDPFYADSYGEYRNYDGKKASPTTLVDEAHLLPADPRAWEGAYVGIWAVPNLVYFRKINGYDPAAHEISFEKLATSHYTERPGKYSLLNSLSALDRPGEFVIQNGENRSLIYVWPHAGGEAGPGEISISRQPFGFNLAGHGDITIEGFTIRKFISRVGHRGAGVTNDEGQPQRIVIRNNVITGCDRDPGSGWKHAAINLGAARQSIVENNQIFENRGCGGIYVFGSQVLVKNNVVRRNGYQGIWIMGARDCQVIGNEVLDNLGTHSNGISVYAGSSNVDVLGNRVFNSNVAFTAEQSSDVTVACNVFYTPQFYAVADWGRTKNLRLLHNVLLRDDRGPGAVLTIGPGTSAVRSNNIFVGSGTGVSQDDSHNLLVGQTDLEKVFLDPARRDYRLKAGSAAIDAGTDAGIREDAVGSPIPQGAADIGAYEFVPGK